MKFKLKEGFKNFDAYGYQFKPDIEVEVAEENLINKFKKYHQIQAVSGAIEVEAQQMSDKEELQAECESKGIEYDKRWGINKLEEALNGD